MSILLSQISNTSEISRLPTDLSVSTPALLLADSRNFNSVAFGTILESAFGTSAGNSGITQSLATSGCGILSSNQLACILYL